MFMEYQQLQTESSYRSRWPGGHPKRNRRYVL